MKVEYVVKPPITPVPNTRRASAPKMRLPSSDSTTIPSANEPRTFTAKVAHGNASQRARVNATDSAHRATVPIAPPSAIKRAVFELAIAR